MSVCKIFKVVRKKDSREGDKKSVKSNLKLKYGNEKMDITTTKYRQLKITFHTTGKEGVMNENKYNYGDVIHKPTRQDEVKPDMRTPWSLVPRPVGPLCGV